MIATVPARQESVDRTSGIDDQNPWPGLAAFDEAAQRFFNGRRKEAAELRRRVLSAPLSVVFGASGLGKTSLLRAGLFPLLRKDDVLPVYVRLDVLNRAAPLVDQIRDAMLEQFREQRVEATPFAKADSLWEWLHRENLELWRRNRRLTLLFVLDQFEEVFTLGAENPEVVARFRIDLADLVENRLPDTVNELISANDAGLSGLALSSYRYRVLVSFREDFLPAVEGLKRDMPSIMTNRMRLLPMSRQQAFEAVHETAPHLADESIAGEIVRFVAAAHGDSAATAQADQGNDSDVWVEPALLSLVCRGLNDRRKAQGKAAFDIALLRGTGEAIVSDYYEATIADVSPKTRRFLEEELITERGFRKPCDIDDARTVHGVSDTELRTLVDRRLLRIEPHQRTHRIELTHDLLTGVVREHRDRQRAQVRTRRQQKQLAAGFAAVLALLAIVLYIAYLTVEARRSNEESTRELAESERNADERARALEEDKARIKADLEEALAKLRGLAPAAGSKAATNEVYRTIDSVEQQLYAKPAADGPDTVKALAQQLNDSSENVRKAAGGRLAHDHRANPIAIQSVLETLSRDNLPYLSASGRINALYFLSRSDSAAWTPEDKELARDAIQRIERRSPSGVAIGSQTRAELQRLKEKIGG